MAIGSVTLATLTQMVQAITRQYTPAEFSPDEIENALNAAQGKVFLMLPKEIKAALYGSKDDVEAADALGETTVDISSLNAWDIVAVRQVLTISPYTVTPMFQADLDFVLSVSENTFRQGVYWARLGSALYLSESIDSDEARVFFILRPTDMSGSNDMDLPDEYRRYLVLIASLDLLSYMQGVPREAITSARQEVVAEGKLLGFYPDLKEGMAQMDAKASSQNEEPLGTEGR